MSLIPLGVYRHYKGKQYEVIGFAKHSETLEDMVIYKALYSKRETWVRPLSIAKIRIIAEKIVREAHELGDVDEINDEDIEK